MSTYGDEEELHVMESIDRISLAMAPAMKQIAEIDLLGTGIAKYLAFVAFPVLAVVFLFVSYSAEIDSYPSQLFLELSSGFAFFAAAPTVLRVGRRYRLPVPAIGVLVSLLLLWLAYIAPAMLNEWSQQSTAFLRSALIEYSAALLLLMGLDIVMMPWLDAIAGKHEKARETLKMFMP